MCITWGLASGLVAVSSGCTTSQAADWAQMSPPLAPVAVSPGFINLGARTDDPVGIAAPRDDDPSPR